MFIFPTLAPGWVPVQSSNLRSVYYDAAANDLRIQFRGGRIYGYANVPPEVHRALMGAGSKGRYFHYNIRSRYRYRRLQ
jgi:hypothetical protein